MAEIDGVLSLLQFRTLVIIATTGQMNLSEVAVQLGVHPSNATRVVEKLVSGRYVDRRDDPQDRRYLALSATARGRALVDRVMDHRRSALAEIVRAMPAARRRDLAAGLQSFAEVAGDHAGLADGFVAPHR
jgi:DNA-binding MarR family transcriptional regulator